MDHTPSTPPISAGRGTDQARPARRGSRRVDNAALTRPPTRRRTPPRGSGHPQPQPTPATVWTCGPTPVTEESGWPESIVTKIVTSFSTRGARVVLLPWPGTAQPAQDTGVIGAHGVIEHAPGGESNPALADTVELIGRLDRHPQVIHLPVPAGTHGPSSDPFWADLVAPGHGRGIDRRASRQDGSASPAREPGAPLQGEADLIITAVAPQQAATAHSDHVALAAARLLRVGGILAVLTHSDWNGGRLVDPTGAIVAAGQNADLLYLQHIVALLAPVRDGQFVSILDTAAAEEEARSQHRATVRGLPTPHRRLHADLLVFSQPHDHQPPPVTVATAAQTTGVLR